MSVAVAMKMNYKPVLHFTYKNYRGEINKRRVQTSYIAFESNEYHPEMQWILYGLDLDKNVVRGFAMKDMSEVTTGNEVK